MEKSEEMEWCYLGRRSNVEQGASKIVAYLCCPKETEAETMSGSFSSNARGENNYKFQACQTAPSTLGLF